MAPGDSPPATGKPRAFGHPAAWLAVQGDRGGGRCAAHATGWGVLEVMVGHGFVKVKIEGVSHDEMVGKWLVNISLV